MDDFKSHDTWMVFKIMGEFVEGFETLRHVGTAISIFGSTRLHPSHRYYKMARKVGELLSREDLAVITGAGPGLMEAANRGARKGSGTSVGLNIRLPKSQESNRFLDVVLNFDYFFARKVMFARYASGYVVLPGGFGTMDEFFEALTLIQTHKMGRFPIVLMGREYWSGLLAWLKSTALREGTILKKDLSLFYVTDDPEDAVRYIVNNLNNHKTKPLAPKRRVKSRKPSARAKGKARKKR